ncbi:hypothetical protein BGZ83_000361 [Gryganskiella cystojenkinii]|nr:hypothetical protein BGZ83_000361 [Gryganskiella cystojenkinii]
MLSTSISDALRHRSVLKEVIMDRVLPLTPEFVEALASCSYLEKVSPIPDFTIQDPEEWISLFERLWSRIRVLSFHISPDSFPLSMTSRPTTTSSSLSSSVLANPDSVTSSSPAPLQWRSSTGANRIRDLEVYTVYEMYATLRWILEQCPELVRFSASIRLGDQWLPLPLEDLALMADLAEMIGSGRSCLRLEDLSLPDEKFQNDDFSSLMNAMHRLTALNLSRTNFNLDSWRILQSVPRHVFTIRNLNLHGCMDLPGAAMQDILCSMPNLEVFYSAEGFFDTDLLEDPRPWACSHRLQDLQLILGIRSFKTSYPTVYSYLAGLTKIENLTIWTPMGCSKSEVFQLHLKQGLDQMRTLGRTLLYLSLPGPNVKPNEARWMLEHWTRLSCAVKDKLALIVSKDESKKVTKVPCLWAGPAFDVHPNLSGLTIISRTPTVKDDHDRTLVSFIKRHRLTLREAKMSGGWTRDVLEALSDCRNLEKIPILIELQTEKDFED